MTMATVKLPFRISAVELTDCAQTPQTPQSNPTPDPQEMAREVQRLLAEPKAELSSASQALKQATEQLHELVTNVTEHVEQQVVQLAFGIAEKILLRQIDQGQYKIDTIIEHALNQLDTRRGVTVRLNPKDLKTSELATQAHDNSSEIMFVPDATIQQGGCFVECLEGFLDLQVHSQLDAITASLQEVS